LNFLASMQKCQSVTYSLDRKVGLFSIGLTILGNLSVLSIRKRGKVPKMNPPEEYRPQKIR
jgi:hypothetical protein